MYEDPEGEPSEGYPRATPVGQAAVFEGHPLFPRADGSPEDRDIRFVTFLRRVDGAIKHCPEDIPRDEIQDWGQVTDWWGGGEYQAIAKTDKHVVIRHYPSKSEWVSLDGPPLPFVKRGPRPPAVAARASESAPQASAPSGMAEVLGVLTKIVDRLDRQPAAPQGGGSDVMIAMINAQASRDAATAQANATRDAATAQANATVAVAEAKARADAAVAQANATAENNKFLLGVFTKKDGPKEGDGTGSLASALTLLKPYLKPDAVPPADPFAMLQKAKELGLLGAPGASMASELKPIAEVVGSAITQQIQADGKARVADAEVRKAEILAGRPEAWPREREREPPPLVHVPGLGMVHVVAAEMAPTRSAPLPAAPAPAAPAPAVAQAPMPSAPPPPVEPAAAPRLRLVPDVPDLEPPRRPTEVRSGGGEGAPPPTEPLVEEVPAEVRSVIEEAVADVTLEDKAQIAGALGRLKQVSVETRIPVIQKFFPALDDREAKQWAEMVDQMPMLAIYGLVEQIAPAELHRIKHLNGFNGPTRQV